jgi:hypothetical protein
MKIKKIQSKNYKLLKFNLIKSKILKKNHYKKSIKLEEIEIRLKKALNIIYLYHINNKRILFVGNPLNINKEISQALKSTKHIFIPKSFWISGIITNQNSSFNSIFKKEGNINKISQIVLKLKNKSNLVVIIDKNFEEKALYESYSSRLPIISLNSDLNPFDQKSSYKIPGNFTFSKNNFKNNFFYSLLLSTLKKSNIVKKHFPYLPHKLSTLSVFKKKKYIKKKNRNYYTTPR